MQSLSSLYSFHCMLCFIVQTLTALLINSSLNVMVPHLCIYSQHLMDSWRPSIILSCKILIPLSFVFNPQIHFKLIFEIRITYGSELIILLTNIPFIQRQCTNIQQICKNMLRYQRCGSQKQNYSFILLRISKIKYQRYMYLCICICI
jgi:hypothetical protein